MSNAEDMQVALEDGQPVLLATDTVYGLAALPNSAGLDAIFQLKQRPAGQVLPWLIINDMFALYAQQPKPYALKLVQMFWPGALTLVVQASREACELGGTAQDGTIALRCPDNAQLQELITALDKPLACTSANMHGAPAVAQRRQLDQVFLALCGADGLQERCEGGMPSSIVDCTGEVPKILRAGSIPEQVLYDVAVYGATLDA